MQKAFFDVSVLSTFCRKLTANKTEHMLGGQSTMAKSSVGRLSVVTKCLEQWVEFLDGIYSLVKKMSCGKSKNLMNVTRKDNNLKK